MPGRNSYRGGGRGFNRGRGGRGGGRSNGGSRSSNSRNQSNQNNRSARPRGYKFHPNVQQHQGKFHTFDETIQHIVSKLASDPDWDDAHLVLKAVEDQRSHRPIPPPPPTLDPTTGRYDEVHMQHWKEQNSKYMKELTSYDKKVVTVAAHIREHYCSVDMKDVLRQLPDYTDVVRDDPVVMLHRIRLIMSQGNDKIHLTRAICPLPKYFWTWAKSPPK